MERGGGVNVIVFLQSGVRIIMVVFIMYLSLFL